MSQGQTERQLHLFRSPRQRGIVPRSQASEFELQCAVMDTFRAQGLGWRRSSMAGQGQGYGQAYRRRKARHSRSVATTGRPALVVELKVKYGREESRRI
jgi:hypothetical protein